MNPQPLRTPQLWSSLEGSLGSHLKSHPNPAFPQGWTVSPFLCQTVFGRAVLRQFFSTQITARPNCLRNRVVLLGSRSAQLGDASLKTAPGLMCIRSHWPSGVLTQVQVHWRMTSRHLCFLQEPRKVWQEFI